MAGFIEGVQRCQTVLFPDRPEDWIGEDDLVRVVDLFVEELDLHSLGFVRAAPSRAGRPGYHPAVLLKLFIYGYLNRIPSSRRLEREAGRNVEVMWLTGRLVPDHKTIAEFRRQNGAAIRKTCARFVELCLNRPRICPAPRPDGMLHNSTSISPSLSSAPRPRGHVPLRTTATR